MNHARSELSCCLVLWRSCLLFVLFISLWQLVREEKFSSIFFFFHRCWLISSQIDSICFCDQAGGNVRVGCSPELWDQIMNFECGWVRMWLGVGNSPSMVKVSAFWTQNNHDYFWSAISTVHVGQFKMSYSRIRGYWCEISDLTLVSFIYLNKNQPGHQEWSPWAEMLCP